MLVAACAGGGVPVDVIGTEDITVGEEALAVRIADDDTERSRGLMGEESLPEDVDGMLFEFDEPGPATFHMRDTLMPLDIWWFNGYGVLVGFTEMEPCEAEPCTRYRSPGIIGWALETPLGVYDFQPGDELSIGQGANGDSG